MAIPERCSRVLALIDRVRGYDAIVRSDSFGNSSLAEMKGNVKDIVDEVKDELDKIKDEVDNW